MRALTVRPGVSDSLALTDIDEPAPADGPVLMDGLGATYHSEALPESGIEADAIIESTGVPSADVMTYSAAAQSGVAG